MSRELDFYQKPQPFDEHLQLTSHTSDLHIRLTMTGLAPGHLKLLNVIVLVRHRFVANAHFAPPAYVVGIVTHSPSSAQSEIACDRKWPVALTGNQGFVDALAKPFDIGRMDEKFAI
jgi:hypothetical protein